MSEETENLGICICCVAKNEQKYINDWVDYHLDLGFEHITIYDNDDDGSPYIGDFINKKFMDRVNIINAHGKRSFQENVYEEFYKNNNFEWCAYIDIDEFIYLDKFDTIQEFLHQDKFKKAQVVKIKWKVFGDDSKIEEHDEDISKPVYDRFLKERDTDESNYIKSIVRGGIEHVVFRNVHYPEVKGKPTGLRYFFSNGAKTNNKIMTNLIDNDNFVYHYRTKTLAEYCAQKLGRGDAVFGQRQLDDEYFFAVNERTPEKERFYLNYNQTEPTDVED